ncbi:Aste57867_18972 [Aphanomyces stellatus]|uniref:Aste57867_18972 protein n=1 Tax=Aphanomyces stellatus TaxID=120398 RepID=A0A485LBR9_9STRA|nr:hypothetical protein As57867_018908 [Aphanomyces stellatus]VFT95701.1 Aste57867_18972 [Aphanomyces stellatus]
MPMLRLSDRIEPIHGASNPRLHSQTLAKLQLRQSFLTVAFFASCVWNLAAPIKAWVLGRYGFASTSTTAVYDLNWNTVLNGRFLTALYQSAGIPLDGLTAMPSTRYINVFLDFMVAPRSYLQWAASFAETETVFQMDIDGLFKRHGLDATHELDQFYRDLGQFQTTGYPLWGTEVIYNYIPPAANGDVALQEITEAVLCLKGMPLEDFVNVQFPSPLHPYSNADDAHALAVWGARMFPHLKQCLARRAQLIQSSSSPQAAVVTLAQELAAAYNVSLVNIAGHDQLHAVQTFQDGFIDVSGLRSGSLGYQISGPNPFAVLTTASGHMDTLLAPRETVWWCTIQYMDPVTGKANATQCFEKVGSTLANFFVGKYLTSSAGTRYIDNGAMVQGGKTGAVTSYTYSPRHVLPLKDVRSVAVPGNLTAWKALVVALIANITSTPPDASNALEEMCFVGDDCFSTCLNASASGGTTLTYMRGGSCVTSVDTISHGLTDLFVDVACFGIGSGTSSIQLTYITQDGRRFQVVASHTAGPMAILACIVGGRFPDIDYPTYLIDLLGQGTQAMLVMAMNSGSEATVINSIALLSLGGYVYYFVRLAIYLYHTIAWVKAWPDNGPTRKQVVFSVVNSSVSSVIWGHYSTSMRCIGFMSLLEWHIGATDNHCYWPASVDNITIDAAYVCTLHPYGHFASSAELVRLFAYAWIFFALTFMDRMPGIAIVARGYVIAVLLLGLVPLSFLAILVAHICLVRAHSPILNYAIHNQLWLGLVWLAMILLLRTKLFSPYVALVERCLLAVAIQKQTIDSASPFYDMVGPHFWTESHLVRHEPVVYLPLSILIETKSIDLFNIFDHEYFVYHGGAINPNLKRGPSIVKLDLQESHQSHKPHHPPWITGQAEYFVRVAKVVKRVV